jgi:hypothetical protein
MWSRSLLVLTIANRHWKPKSTAELLQNLVARQANENSHFVERSLQKALVAPMGFPNSLKQLIVPKILKLAGIFWFHLSVRFTRSEFTGTNLAETAFHHGYQALAQRQHHLSRHFMQRSF